MRKSEEKGDNFLGSKRRILKFTYSSNLAKTESLLIFVKQKLSSGPMCYNRPRQGVLEIINASVLLFHVDIFTS